MKILMILVWLYCFPQIISGCIVKPGTIFFSEKLSYQGKEYFMKEELFPQWRYGMLRLKKKSISQYQALWKIKNNKLYLLKLTKNKYIKTAKENERDVIKIDASQELGNQINLPYFAKWYSGTIVLPQGKILWSKSYDCFADIRHEWRIELTFKDGILIKSEKLQYHLADLYRSHSDLKRVGKRHQKDGKDWVDFRLFKTDLIKQFEKEGAVIPTRSAVFWWEYSGKKELILLVNLTPKSKRAVMKMEYPEKLFQRLNIKLPPAGRVIDNYYEVQLIYQKKRWIVKYLRRLKKWESLYHPDYPELIKGLK